MSEDDTIDPADGGKLIAAEYVLGVLGAEERREVERRLAQEPALASEVAFWEERLTGLADAVAPVSPPQVTWSRIETAIGVAPRPPSVWQSLAFWRSFGIASAPPWSTWSLMVRPSSRKNPRSIASLSWAPSATGK